MNNVKDSFDGFVRADGTVGVRNHLLVLSITGLTGPTARRISSQLACSVVVDYVYDSGPVGEDREAQERGLLGLALNPNVGAVLLISANPSRAVKMAEKIAKTKKPIEVLTLDDCGHDALVLTERGLEIGQRLLTEIDGLTREPAPISKLYVAMECGRSDPSSGLVSNPLMGLISDRLVDAGARAIIGESVEWLGAEHLLAKRAVSASVKQQILDAVSAREQAAIDAGIDLTGNNPGPTNIAAGLSTIEEKSLGNIAKSGSRPIQSLVKWAEAPYGSGMHLMDAPAYAPESLTGFAASGTQLMFFSTGVGNSFVNSIAPTIKISGNPETCERLDKQLDFKCSEVFVGEKSLEEASEEMFDIMLNTASGKETWGEIIGEGSEAFTRLGASI
jgi:altronate dehydratase large subunit